MQLLQIQWLLFFQYLILSFHFPLTLRNLLQINIDPLGDLIGCHSYVGFPTSKDPRILWWLIASGCHHGIVWIKVFHIQDCSCSTSRTVHRQRTVSRHAFKLTGFLFENLKFDCFVKTDQLANCHKIATKIFSIPCSFLEKLTKSFVVPQYCINAKHCVSRVGER